MRRPNLTREKVLATVVRLLEVSLIRIGNEEYAKENKSFGLTTMRNRHVEVDGSIVRFQFRGKSGKRHLVEVSDWRLATVVRKCQDLPGQQLFEYLDPTGEIVPIASEDVNDYLQTISRQPFTGKIFGPGRELSWRRLLSAKWKRWIARQWPRGMWSPRSKRWRGC
jgi:DNA topoisomerase-1